MNKNKLLGNLILFGAAFVWGLSFAFQKTGVSNIPPFTFGASRCLLSALSVGLVAFITEKTSKVKRPYAYKRNTIRGGLICGVFLTIACNLQQFGLVRTSAGKGAFITALYMLIIPIICAIVFKQKIGLKLWISVGIGVVGMYLLCITENFTIARGDLLVLGCAFFFSLQMLSVDRFVPMASPLWMSAIQFTVNCVVSGICAFIFENPSLAQVLTVLPEVLYCGLVSGGVGYTLQMIGQGKTDPTSAGLLLSFESVFGAVGGALFLDERMSTKELIGAIVMFVAIILVQLPSKNKNE